MHEAEAQESSSEKTAAAQTLYDQGMAALDAKDHAKACPKFEAASKLVPEGIGVKLMLAQCYEESGRLASAWSVYRVAESEAARVKQEERRLKAQRRVEALESRIARLTVVVPEDVAGAPGLLVKRGSVELSPALFGTATPVDAGEITITASSGRGTFEKRITIKDGDRLDVTITFERPKPVETPPVVEPEPTATASLPPLAIGGIVIGSLGVALAGAGVGLGIKALGDQSDADAICPQEACGDQRAIDLSDQANTFSIAAWVGIGVGAAAIGTGIALLVVSTRTSSSGATTSEIVARPTGLSYRLRF